MCNGTLLGSCRLVLSGKDDEQGTKDFGDERLSRSVVV